MTVIDPKLLEILVCPVTKTRLIWQGDELISEAAALAYPIRNGIPIMLVEEARPLDNDEESLLKIKNKRNE
ncbi:MAG: Trm112 family protein [Alphaproteobacteria bacterium]